MKSALSELRKAWKKSGWLMVWSLLVAWLFGNEVLTNSTTESFLLRVVIIFFILAFALQAGIKEEN